MSTRVSIPDIIAKKRDKEKLAREEIEVFVRGLIDGTVEGSQLGIFLMF